jgi:hypothetical protein
MQVDFREVEAQVVTGRELLVVLDMALKFRAEAIGWDEEAFREFAGVEQKEDERRDIDADIDQSIRDSGTAWRALWNGQVDHYADLLALNRDQNPVRAHGYALDMLDGRWWFAPDPVVFTDTALLANGQHRALALSVVEPIAAGRLDDLAFVLVTGVDAKAALIIDEARRTANDRRDITIAFATYAV